MARGSRLARLAALGLLGVLTLTGCDMPNNEFWRFGWPDGITEGSASTCGSSGPGRSSPP